jgi:hypothetical protein
VQPLANSMVRDGLTADAIRNRPNAASGLSVSLTAPVSVDLVGSRPDKATASEQSQLDVHPPNNHLTISWSVNHRRLVQG